MINYLAKSFSDIFKDIDPATLQIKNNLSIPNDFYRQLLDYALERGFLNDVGEREKFLDFAGQPGEVARRITWMRIDRLPIHPNEMREYDLISRWQGVLATLHTWGHRLIFLLQRKNGETGLYLGTASLSREITSAQAIEQFKEAATGSMPGIDLKPLSKSSDLQTLSGNLMEYNVMGAVTGIPSLKKDTQFGMLQTLDRLAFGVRDGKGLESDFSLMVVADPLNDAVISETIFRFRELGSQIHLDVRRSLNESEDKSQTKSSGMGGTVGSLVGSVVGGIGGPAAAKLMAGILGNVGALLNSSKTQRVGMGVTTDYLDKFAEYAENVTDMHCQRLMKGRNLGFWNAGIYVLGKSHKDINTVMGILRSVYSGDLTYIEPIRASILQEHSGAIDIARRGDLIPLANEHSETEEAMGEWNIFGRAFQYLSTPLNTEELSLATSLPRRDVPGLRFVKSSVRFANNPAQVDGDTVCLGRVVDTGVLQKNEYRINPDALVRHGIVAGITGSGKSVTCKTIISEVMERDIPVMIIEPAKDDYVRWAIKYNKKIDEDKKLTHEQKSKRKFKIFMPGVEFFEGIKTERLKLDPFQPAAIPNAPIDMMTRVEQATALFNASLPNADVLPVIVDEAMYKYVYDILGERFLASEMEALKEYPLLDGVANTAKNVLATRGYEPKIKDNLGAALETRFSYLTRGKRGQILNVNSSTNFGTLFDTPVIINVTKIANAKDKALIMSLLMLALYEYRISAYTYDEEYRKKAQSNKLLHLAVIEEAHNLLNKPSHDSGGTGNPQQVVADLFSNMLSEIRGYGQGILVVDQIPTRLIPDTIKNTNYKIVHRLTSPDDSDVMASGLALREDQKKIIPALGVGDAIICGDLDDAAAWVKINYKG
ncbi:MAG: ATP-binding protein [Oscillospiraceae bacterium]|nr:ATP-binding protein [Oscillospiraceae bacterium]